MAATCLEKVEMGATKNINLLKRASQRGMNFRVMLLNVKLQRLSHHLQHTIPKNSETGEKNLWGRGHDCVVEITARAQEHFQTWTSSGLKRRGTVWLVIGAQLKSQHVWWSWSGCEAGSVGPKAELRRQNVNVELRFIAVKSQEINQSISWIRSAWKTRNRVWNSGQ